MAAASSQVNWRQRAPHSLPTLASLSTASGANPQGTVAIDSSGNIFGVAPNGGANGDGTIFELSPLVSEPIARLLMLPEPSTWLLLAIGGAALFACGVRNRRAVVWPA